MNIIKNLGQTFTPSWIVNFMLDKINYNDTDILNKTILEPSCGNGAFLTEIVKRFIEIAIKNGKNKTEIKNLLEQNIFGVEIDKILYNQCLQNLDHITQKYGINNVKWNIICGDFLSCQLEKMDFIVGNPPYVRIHNLDLKTRNLIKNKYSFCKNGITDLYIAFYEEVLNLIKTDGIVSFITPNSFLRNASAKTFRNYVSKNHLLHEFIDFGERQIFEKVSTYTAICILKHYSCKTRYYKYQNNKIEFIKEFNLNNFINKDWCFDVDDHAVPFFKSKKFAFDVKYGFATLRDKIYISDIDNEQDKYINFNGFKIEKDITKPVIKASLSNKKSQRIIYPYLNFNHKAFMISEKDMQETYPYCYEYLLHHKSELLKRDIDKDHKAWYQYGRSQAINHIFQDKLVISGIAKDSINVRFADANTAVYSGMFLISDHLQEIHDILQSKDFLTYIRKVGKDIRGGYKTFNTRQIKEFLNSL